VRIVEGGLAAWPPEAGGLEGTDPPGRLRTLPPLDYLAERGYDHWLIVRVGEDAGDRPAGAPAPPPAARVLAPATDPARLREQLTALAQPTGSGLYPLVLITAARPADLPPIAAAVQGAAPWNLFVLEGGDPGYTAAVARLEGQWNRDPRPQGAVGACARR
jgi:hypothetical protein